MIDMERAQLLLNILPFAGHHESTAYQAILNELLELSGVGTLSPIDNKQE